MTTTPSSKGNLFRQASFQQSRWDGSNKYQPPMPPVENKENNTQTIPFTHSYLGLYLYIVLSCLYSKDPDIEHLSYSPSHNRVR